MTDKRLDALRKTLRAKLRDGDGVGDGERGGDVAVPAADLRTLLDEVGRLQQSNDRLRRQNRRVRLRLQRAGLDDADAVDGDEPRGDGAGDGGDRGESSAP
jgi:hypothetical protein